MRAVEIPHVPQRGDRPRAARAPRCSSTRVGRMLLTATCHNALWRLRQRREQGRRWWRSPRSTTCRSSRAIPFGDLVFSGERPRPLKAFDKTGIVLQCSSLGALRRPGLQPRLGQRRALAGRGRAAEGLHATRPARACRSSPWPSSWSRARSTSTSSSSGSRSGTSVEASRHEILRTFPKGTRVSRPEGGFVLWVQLPEPYDGLELQRQAAAVGRQDPPGRAVLGDQGIQPLRPHRPAGTRSR